MRPSRSTRFVSTAATLLGLLVPLAGAQTTKQTTSTSLELTVVGGPALNPNAQGRASPVVVRIFDLSETGAFESADYAALFERAPEMLQHDILAQEELVLRPGDMQERNRPLQPGVKALGVAAAFRDLEHAVWRLTVRIKPGKRNFVLIGLDQDRIRQDPVESPQS